MAKFFRGKDIFQSAELLAELGNKVLLLSAVNKTDVDMSGKKMKFNENTIWQFGSMSAGTSMQMAERYPGVQRWWAKRVSEGVRHGVHVYGGAREELSYLLDIGVATVKDVWWQEAPQDARRIAQIIEGTIIDIDRIARQDPKREGYDFICVPLLGTGFGQMDTKRMQAMMEALPDNVLVFTK